MLHAKAAKVLNLGDKGRHQGAESAGCDSDSACPLLSLDHALSLSKPTPLVSPRNDWKARDEVNTYMLRYEQVVACNALSVSESTALLSEAYARWRLELVLAAAQEKQRHLRHLAYDTMCILCVTRILGLFKPRHVSLVSSNPSKGPDCHHPCAATKGISC